MSDSCREKEESGAEQMVTRSPARGQSQQLSTPSELWLKDEPWNPLPLLIRGRIMCVCGQGGLSWDVYFLVIVTRANLSLVISFCAWEQ